MSKQFLVNGLYPLEYFTVSGVDQVKYPHAYFWASKPRFASVGGNGSSYVKESKGGNPTSEFLEIDLGRVREISYINFSVVRGPMDITVQYDALSSTDGTHRWVEVTPIHNEPFTDSLHYDANTKSPFHDAEFYFTDSQGHQINTRFMRIKFARRDVEWPHKGANPFRWPVAVKSLRTARFVDSYRDTLGILFDAGVSPDDDAHKQLFSISQAQADDTSFQVGTDFVCQQFGLPSDFVRGTADQAIPPNLLGFSALVYIDPTGGDTTEHHSVASVAWELWEARASNRIFTKVASGTKTNVPNDRRVWLDVYFPESDPVEVPDTNVIFEIRLKTLTAHDATAFPVLRYIFDADNNVPGFVLPGTSTWVNAGNNPAGAAAGSNVVEFTEDVSAYLQAGDTLQRYDRLGGFQATVLSVLGGTVTLTQPYQGADATGVLGMRVLGERFSVLGTESFTRSLCLRLWGDVGDTGRDVLGNFYRYATRRDKSDHVFDSQTPGWYSEPQPDTNAVESLYFDTRWSDSGGRHSATVDAIRIVPRTPGVLMHVYYCDDHLDTDTPRARNVWDKLLWQPIHTTYELNGRMTITLPQSIRANFIKLEFTKLQPQPYNLPPRPEHTAVEFRRYPTWIENQFDNAKVRRTVRDWFTDAARKGIVKIDVLKSMTSPIQEFEYKEREFLAALATNRKFDKDEINSGLIDTKTNSFIDPTTGSKISVSTTRMYQSPLQLTVDKDTVLGQAVAAAQAPTLRTAVREGGFNASRGIAPFVSTSKNRIAESFSHLANTPMWFNRVCRHVYKIDKAKFHRKAYFVGIQSVEFLRKDNTVARDEALVVENLWDDQMLEFNTWLRENPSQLAALLAVRANDSDSTKHPVNVLVTYEVDGITYTDESQSFVLDPDTPDGTPQPVILFNGGSEQAINIVVWIQNDDGTRGPIQFHMGRDFTSYHTDDGLGNLTNLLTPVVASNRLVVNHISDNFDEATVTGRAVIDSDDTYTPYQPVIGHAFISSDETYTP